MLVTPFGGVVMPAVKSSWGLDEPNDDGPGVHYSLDGHHAR